ncbi:hypothetical protein pb186bvf_019247 [Paramecium bursaria]
MQKVLLAIGLVALLGAIVHFQTNNVDSVAVGFQNFKARFNKKYTPQEESYRLAVYRENANVAAAHNAKVGREAYGETMFFDLTDEEFKETYLTLRVNKDEKHDAIFKADKNYTAKKVDWRIKGADNVAHAGHSVQQVHLKDTTSITTGTLPNLSEQQLLDCSTWADINFGCNGGMPARALNYVKRNGITTEAAYKYTAVQGTCQIKGGNFKINGHTAVNADEASILEAVVKGPLSVAVDATNWKYYKEGLWTEKDCQTAQLNHAVLAVAITDEALVIKNSWSTAWGEKGYINLALGVNTCGVWDSAVFPN